MDSTVLCWPTPCSRTGARPHTDANRVADPLRMRLAGLTPPIVPFHDSFLCSTPSSRRPRELVAPQDSPNLQLEVRLEELLRIQITRPEESGGRRG